MLTEYGLAGITGFVLSLFFEWFPWVAGQYEALNEQGKRLVMILALLIVTGVIFGLGCWPTSPVHAVSCDEAGFWQIGTMFVVALTTNQSAHGLFKKPV